MERLQGASVIPGLAAEFPPPEFWPALPPDPEPVDGVTIAAIV